MLLSSDLFENETGFFSKISACRDLTAVTLHEYLKVKIWIDSETYTHHSMISKKIGNDNFKD